MEEKPCEHCGGKKRPRTLRVSAGQRVEGVLIEMQGNHTIRVCPTCCPRCGDPLTYDNYGPWCMRCD